MSTSQKTMYPGAGANVGGFVPQGQFDQANQKTVYPGMTNSATAMNSNAGRPIMGFLFSVSKNAAGEYWPIYVGANLIGRGDKCVVKLNDPCISGEHVTLIVREMINNGVKTGNLVYLQDAGSQAGTMLNGVSLGFQPAECQQGDIITVGPNYELYLMLIDVDKLGLKPKEALKGLNESAPTPNPGWQQTGMHVEGPKGTEFAHGGNSGSPFAAPSATIYMPGN